MKTAWTSLLLCAIVLSGCSQTTPVGNNALMTTNGQEVKITQQGPGGSTVTIAGGKYPAEAPVAQYPGSTVTVAQVIQNPSAGMPKTNIILSTKDAPDKVMAFYKNEISAKGWTADNQVDSPVMASMTVKAGTGEMTISAMGGGEGTTISVVGQ